MSVNFGIDKWKAIEGLKKKRKEIRLKSVRKKKKGDWFVAFSGETQKENIFQKLGRLKYEVETFKNEIDSAYIQELTTIDDYTREEYERVEHLIKFLEEEKKITKEKKVTRRSTTKKKKKPKKESESVTVENQAKQIHLEKRISNLEKVYGFDKSSEDEISDSHVTRSLEKVEKQISSLNPYHKDETQKLKNKENLDKLVNKIKVINSKIYEIEKSKTKKKEGDEEEEEKTKKLVITHDKVNNLFYKIQNWGLVEDHIPLLIKRLKSLHIANLTATTLKENLGKMKKIGEGNEKIIVENEKIYAETERKMKKDINEIQKKIQMLDASMNKLIKKLKKLIP